MLWQTDETIMLSGMPETPDCTYDIDNVDDVCDTGPLSLALLV